MYTHEQRLNNECSHHEYYAQFVTPAIAEIVYNFAKGHRYDLCELLERDEHLNSIPLRYWDELAGSVFGPVWNQKKQKLEGRLNNHYGAELSHKMEAAGDYVTLSGMVCVLKCALRVAVEEK